MRLSALALILVFALLCLSGLGRANAATNVVINEFEQNPPGNEETNGGEYVELYNPTSSNVSIGGWIITTTHVPRQPYNISLGTLLLPGQFWVHNFTGQFIDNVGDSVKLLNRQGILVDETPISNDTSTSGSGDTRSWQRIPDGGTDWQLREGTPGRTNSPTTTQQVTTTTQQQTTTSLTTASTTTAATTTQTTTITHLTTSIAEVGAGSGFGFAVIAIGAGLSAAGAGVAVAASGRTYSDVFAYGGYYYCRIHRIPVWLVGGGLWCPLENRYLSPPRIAGSQ